MTHVNTPEQIIGSKVGRLTLIEFRHRDGAYEIYLGECSCGHVEQVRIYSPLEAKACGCPRTGPRGRKGGVRRSSDRADKILITAGGKTQRLTQWSAESGIKYKTLYARLAKGIAPEQALALALGGAQEKSNGTI